tara:strand:- start:438 stop:623 length:186 start_codon:yes stop_codon:yes gene_type:complete
MRDEFECSVVQDFIDDHSDLALLYAIKQEKGDCDEMCEFIEEMHLTHKFLLYSHMRASLGN